MLHQSRRYQSLAVLCAGLLVLTACSTQSNAEPGEQFEPPKQVEFVVHSSPGGGMDIAGRQWSILLQKEEVIDGSWTVSNQSGGSGAKAMAYLAQRHGKTDVISGMTTSWFVTPLTTAEAEYDVLDFTPIAQLLVEQAVVVTSADSGYDSFQDFLAAARDASKNLIQAGGVVSSVDNLVRQIIQEEEGVEWNYLNIESSGQRVTALLNGDADILIVQPQEVIEHVRAGTIKVLGAVSEERIALYPEVPTLLEQGIESELPPQVRGILGPPDMPQAAVDYYIDVLKKLVKTDGWQEYATDNAVQTKLITGDEFGDLLEKQVQLYSDLLDGLGLLKSKG